MQSSGFTAILLPLALAVVMLGMGLSLTLGDFWRVAAYPKAVGAGLIGQLVLVPALAMLLGEMLPMAPEMAVCPGGASSNLITYLAKGDVALSVTLTALSSLVTVFTIPLLTLWAAQRFLGDGVTIALPLGPTLLQLGAIVLLPTGLGMLWLRFRLNGWKNR